ncbi:1-acyl-sn-glycerol-3-phosphate acyltransferase [Thermodesulfobacteriota bacterium]
MTGQITISLWLFVLMMVLACWAAWERIFIPSVRWVFRRRINRVIDEISTRLDIKIRPFQLTKRQVLIDRLVFDPNIIAAIHAHAQESFTPREVLQAEVQTYAKEIVPSFNAYLYFRIGYWLAKKVARLLYRVRVGLVDNAALATIHPESTVVFVMNHRSNMDYILVAFLAAERTTLSYAVGEWARIWPLQTLIKSMGAFFVRRNSGNPLYRLVLERYIHMATEEGVCQAVFLEGGLSRDGRLRPPKLGFVDYMLRDFDIDSDRDIVFIPVGINYERTIEDRSLVRTLDPAAKKRSLWFVAKTTFGFIWHNLMLMIFSRWHHFGYACVNFGTHISMRDYCRSKSFTFNKLDRTARFQAVEKLCQGLMNDIAAVIPALPLSLVAHVMATAPDKGMSSGTIKAHVYQLINRLQALGAPVFLPEGSRDHAIETALDMLTLRHFVTEEKGLFKVDPDARDVLLYYANTIAHWETDLFTETSESTHAKETTTGR